MKIISNPATKVFKSFKKDLGKGSVAAGLSGHLGLCYGSGCGHAALKNAPCPASRLQSYHALSSLQGSFSLLLHKL